jgi:DNA invertase Pin-like site-specific DNA recombinase
MIAAIYARKSNEQTGVADDMKSVEIQIASCRQCAERHGWEVAPAHIYIDDGISGADFVDRSGFLKLMNALKPRPAFDVLIMTEVSRLGREQIKTSRALQEITGAGVIVWMAHEGRECRLESAMDKAILGFQTFGAELEREKASSRTHSALEQKFLAGHVTGGRCFGYRNVDVLSDTPDVHGRRKRLYVRREVHKEESAVIVRIFEMYAAGRGLNTIAKTLNDERATCPKPTRGRPPGSPSSVREALYRRDYKGEIVWNKSEKKYRADGKKHQRRRPESERKTRQDESLRILTDEQWQAAHVRLSEIRDYALRLRGGKLAAGPPPVDVNSPGRRPAAARVPFLLSGLSKCMCGSGFEAFRRPWQDTYFYYCAAHRRKGETICPRDIKLLMEVAD